MIMERIDGRLANQVRKTQIHRDYIMYAEGSVLIEVGNTKVICTASVEDKVPVWLRGQGVGWISAEYAMIPRATQQRNVRELSRGKISGRSQEIQRLVGRALRAVVNLEALGEKTVWVDCDVIQADGGTRTSAITGSFIAIADAFNKVFRDGPLPLYDFLAATSVGILNGQPLLDLCYAEDSKVSVDLNLVMTGADKIVEVQGTAEGEPFSWAQMLEMSELAKEGIRQLIALQKEVLGPVAQRIGGVTVAKTRPGNHESR
jgi:ribonuclease PH